MKKILAILRKQNQRLQREDKKQREINQQIGKRKQELREKSKGMVLTDIDLPFGRVFLVTVQFFVAGLVLAIPIWIIFFLIVSN